MNSLKTYLLCGPRAFAGEPLCPHSDLKRNKRALYLIPATKTDLAASVLSKPILTLSYPSKPPLFGSSERRAHQTFKRRLGPPCVHPRYSDP
jgi:hypothetical protein